MMRPRDGLLVLTAALALAGCGSDEEGDPIPQTSVAAIEEQLDNIRAQLDDGSVGACNDIKTPGDTFETLEAAVQNVPQSVDPDVRDALERSVDRLGDLVDEECASLEAETETTPEETETVTIETVPEETTTVEPPPEETTPAETVPEPPQDENGEDEGGSEPGGGGTGGGGLPAPGGGE